MADHLPSGFEPTNHQPGDTDVGAPTFHDSVALSKERLSPLEGDPFEAWRLVFGDRRDDGRIEADGELWLTEDQADGLCDLKAEIDRQLRGGAF